MGPHSKLTASKLESANPTLNKGTEVTESKLRCLSGLFFSFLGNSKCYKELGLTVVKIIVYVYKNIP